MNFKSFSKDIQHSDQADHTNVVSEYKTANLNLQTHIKSTEVNVHI